MAEFKKESIISFGYIIEVIIITILLLVILWICLMLAKRRGLINVGLKEGTRITVLETRRFGRNNEATVMQVDNKEYLVVSNGNVIKLISHGEIDKTHQEVES